VSPYPPILVQNGKPVEKNLRSERLDLHDVAEEARGQGIGNLTTIKWCVLETSGQMTFIKNGS
jgi:uncharacterized membrane protein YcaP (DUF421 family)